MKKNLSDYEITISEIPYIEGDRLILKQITREDTSALRELVSSDVVFKMEPTFLFERNQVKDSREET